MNDVLTVMMTGIVSVLVVTLLLHHVLRFTRLQASVISGLLSIAVLVPYLIMNWTGGDVAALYFSCNILTSYAYYLVGKKTNALKGKDGKRTHWVPITVFGFFVVLTILDGAFVFMAESGLRVQYVDQDGGVKSVNTRFPGEVPNAYHKKEAYFNAHKAKMREQAERGWKVRYQFEHNPPRMNEENIMSFLVVDREGVPIEHAEVSINLKRLAEQELNRIVPFTEVGQGIYEAPMMFERLGRWDFEVHIKKGDEVYQDVNDNLIEVIPPAKKTT
ncbi:FixH family protein [Wohlfahrtiimonas chitiniclastica]|uniref:FixH family protein n=1 Tax=Wohlfahrtiimonas chitiniclastica TaxID=400946 RepID=UPI00035D387F|nr:FixH family protein [Wohlfahrtiimonas chitiniclastica]